MFFFPKSCGRRPKYAIRWAKVQTEVVSFQGEGGNCSEAMSWPLDTGKGGGTAACTQISASGSDNTHGWTKLVFTTAAETCLTPGAACNASSGYHCDDPSASTMPCPTGFTCPGGVGCAGTKVSSSLTMFWYLTSDLCRALLLTSGLLWTDCMPARALLPWQQCPTCRLYPAQYAAGAALRSQHPPRHRLPSGIRVRGGGVAACFMHNRLVVVRRKSPQVPIVLRFGMWCREVAKLRDI